MNVKFLDAISTLFTLQRWNFVPRVETWVEAENIAYVSHLIYAVGRGAGLKGEQVEQALARVILKSFTKHYLSDISHYTRKAINDVKEGMWSEIQKDACKDTLELFPKAVHPYIQSNLIKPLYNPEAETSIEEKLLRFVQMEVAKSECETNKKAYPNNPYYKDLIHELDADVQRFPKIDDFRSSMTQLKTYGEYIKNMKYLRRWNRINRSVETSVMSHTFVVAALTLITSCIETSNPKRNLPENFIYKSILRALFHDVPEAFTGDVITPVKKRIAKHAGKEWSEIEMHRLKPLFDNAPEQVITDIDEFELMKELPSGNEVLVGSNKDLVGSLVKECDRLSALLECIFEHSTGLTYGEMDQAYKSYARILLESPWQSIRKITLYGLFRKREG